MECRPTGRFTAESRVRSRRDFQRVQRIGLKVVAPHFVFLVTQGVPGSVARLGITASRRVGNAVERNRAKRLVREAFRTTRDLWQRGVDVVVIVRSDLGTSGLADVVGEWRGVERNLRRTQGQALQGRSHRPPESEGSAAKGTRERA